MGAGSDVGAVLFSHMGPQRSLQLEEVRLAYARQLYRWGTLGGRSLKTELLQMPDVANGGTALVRAEAIGRSGRFLGYGSADAALVGSNDPGRLLECAEALAKLDALRSALATLKPKAAPVDSASGTTPAGAPRRSRAAFPFEIPAELAARQRIDLTQPPQGEGAQIYQYFHQLIGQMKRRSRQLKETDLGLLDQVTEQQRDMSFYTYSPALLMVSHVIEDEFVQRQLAQPFYAAFQYFSRVRPQEARYRAILRHAPRVVVFGLADAPLWPESRLEGAAIDLRLGTGMERFWCVATMGPDWNTAMLAEHVAGDFTGSLSRRQYQGFWTFDPLVVERIVRTLDYARTMLPGAR